MVAYVFFPKEVAITHLEALKEEASRLAERFGLNEQEWWWNYRGDDIVFAFAKHGDRIERAADACATRCELSVAASRALGVSRTLRA